MRRAIVVLAAACAACGKRPVPPTRAGGEARDVPSPGRERERERGRKRRAPPVAGVRAARPPESVAPAPEVKARELAWDVKPPGKLPDERGRIMCFFKNEFETGTTLGWENAELVSCPGRPGQCLLLAPAPDARSAVSARLEKDKIFAQSSDFLMTLLCAADSPVEVTVQVSSEKAPGRLFEKRLRIDAPDKWVRFDFPTADFRSDGDPLPESGMVSELVVRAGGADGKVRLLLDDVRIYMRLPELPPEPVAVAPSATPAPARRLPPGVLFLNDFERSSEGWGGRRITRRGGGRALAGVEARKGAKSLSASRAFRFEVKPGLRLALSCKFVGEGMVIVALFGEEGGYYFTILGGLKAGEWTDLDIPVDGRAFFTTTPADREYIERTGSLRRPLEEGTTVKVIAFAATGEKAEEMVLDDVMLYVSAKPVVLPAASLVPELASGPEWFDLFDGRTLDGWQEPYPIKWTVKGGSLYASAPFQEGYLYTRETFADFELQVRLRPGKATPGKPELRLKFRWDFDEAAGYELRAGKTAVLVKCGEGGDETLATAELGYDVEKGRPCVVRVLARGKTVECRINGKKVASVSVEGPAEGAIGLGVFHGEIFGEAVKLKELD